MVTSLPTKKENEYPSYVKPTTYGKGLYASKDLSSNTAIAQFEGPIVDTYEQVPTEDEIYALLFQPEGGNDWKWLITQSDAKYSNHCCKPNCYLDGLVLKTFKDVKKDEELTWIYNKGDESEQWEDEWTFDCKCGAENCQGMIDRYRPVDIYGNKVEK